MKRLIFILLVLLSFIDVKAQFPSTDSLRNYNIVWITNNAARAFTNYRLHTLLAGMIDWIDTARTGGGGSIGIDSIAALNDSTIRYRINGTFRTFNLKGVYDARRKLDTLYKTSDTTLAFRINDLPYTITIPGRINFVDSIYRKTGQDSIFYRRNGIEYALKDSTGSTGSTNTNVGSGFRWAVVHTNQIKTAVAGYGVLIDSTSTANSLRFRADTTGTNGLVTRTELLDSTDITTQVESPIYVKLRATWPVPDTLAIDTTELTTRDWLYKVSDSLIALMATSGVANTNTDTDFRWLVPSSQAIKTAANSSTILWDSTSNSNSLTAKVDTSAAGIPTMWNVNNGGKTYPDEKPLGIIYEKNQWSDISGDLLPNPSGTNLLSISSGYLNSSAAAFSYNNYVRILPGRPTDMNRWKMTVRFRNTAWSANSFEFGVGIYSAVSHSGAAFGYIAFLQTTQSGSGNLFIYDQSGAVQRATGSGTVTYALNDEIELIYTYADSVLTFTAQNITTGGTLRTATYTFPNNMSVILPNNGNWGLFEGNGGTGTHQVRYIKIESLETQYPNLLIIGNSKTKGYFAGSYADRFASQLNATYPTVVPNSGSAERLTDMLTRIDEFTQLNASQVWLVDAASNQLRAGTSIADTWVMYDQLTRTLEGGGATVLHSVLPEDSTGGGLGQTAWNALINAKYPGRVIGLYAGMSSGNIGTAAYLNADKVHLSQAGHNQVVSLAISSGLITTISPNRRAPYRVHDDVVKFTGDSLHFKWKVRSRNNYVPRWSTNLDELTTGPLFMDSSSLIMSLSTRPTKPLSTMFASFEGAIASYGSQGSYFSFDRTTPANYYGWYSDNNILRFLYTGTDRAYLNSIGALRLGNASVPTASGMLHIENNQTLANTLGRLGININIDTTITTAPNTSHPFIVGNAIGPHSVISTSSGNTTTAANFYIADSMVASTNHAFLGRSYALYINNGRTRLGTTDSVGTATGGFLFKDFSTGEIMLTAAPSGGGGGITSINGETGAAQTLTASNGLTRTTTTNNVDYELGGTLSKTTNILGAGQTLSIGTAGSKLGPMAVNGSTISMISDNRLNLFGGITYLAVQHTADANLTMNTGTGILELATGSLTTDRTITLPTATVHGQVLTIVVRFASSGSHYVLSAAVEDIKTGSTFTQLDWGTTYEFMVNASIGWMLIRKY